MTFSGRVTVTGGAGGVADGFDPGAAAGGGVAGSFEMEAMA